MSRTKIFALAFAGVFAVMGLSAVSAQAQSAQPQAIQYTNVERGSQTAIGKIEIVIRDDSTWSTVWAKHSSNVMPGPHKPVINFQNEMVIGVFLGSRPSSGYSVNIDSIVDNGSELVVTYTEGRPPAGGISLTVMTAPYQMVRVPTSSKPVIFQNSANKPVAPTPVINTHRFRVTFKNEVTAHELNQALDGKAQMVSMKRVAARPSDPGFKVDLRAGTPGDPGFSMPAPKVNDPGFNMKLDQPDIYVFDVELKTKLSAADITTTLRQLPQVAKADLNTAPVYTAKFTVRFKKGMDNAGVQALLGDKAQVVTLKTLNIDGGDPGLFLLELRSEMNVDEAAQFLRSLPQVDPESVYVRVRFDAVQ
jgi:hypothetical protein